MGVADQNFLDAIDPLSVLFLRHIADARSFAQTDMRIQTRIIPFFQFARTAAQRKQLFHHVKVNIDQTGGGVGTEVKRTVVDAVAGFENFRKRFVCNAQQRIRFAVFERDVVFRLILFDEVIFKKKRVAFRNRNDKVDSCNVLDQGRCFNVPSG